jgi:hypothetical protein
MLPSSGAQHAMEEAMMKRLCRALILALVTVALVGNVAAAEMVDSARYRKEATDSAMMGDIFFLRPLGLLATGLGAVTLVISLPFTIPTSTTGEATEKFVKAPFRFTFQRPFGQLPE